jgi:hypothetical protein
MRRIACYSLLTLVTLSSSVMTCEAAMIQVIPVPNGDFESLPPDPNLDGDNDYNTGDISPPWNGDNLRRNTNEAFTRPSTFVLGWQSNGGADADDGNPVDDGRFGLQQPRSGTSAGQLYYQRTVPAGTVPTGDLIGGFEGNLIGFLNIDDQDGFVQEAQSVAVDELRAGTYTLKVAVGARANANWNDIKYDIMLVANPVPGLGAAAGNKFGSSGGSLLGTPATTTMVVIGTVPDTTNIQELTYTLDVNSDNPLIGSPIAIRITAQNMLVQNGVPDPNAPPTGTNARFTQANFDNVRLTYVPEPGSFVLALGCGFALAGATRRRN